MNTREHARTARLRAIGRHPLVRSVAQCVLWCALRSAGSQSRTAAQRTLCCR